jgi:ATP-dependent Lon protease
LNQRDVIAVRKTVSGLIKLLYPHGEYTRENVEEILKYALEGRRRVKEQLKKIGGMEFYDVHFSYIDRETLNEEYVSVPEQGGGKLIPEGMGKPGHVYTVGHGDSGIIGVFKLENQVVSGTGKFEKSGVGSHRGAKESLDTAFRYFTANCKSISSSISTKTKDYLMHISDLQGIGLTNELAIAELVGLCSAALERPVQESMVVLGNMTVGGTIAKVEEFANVLQVCVDAGAKRVLIPASSVVDLQTVPPDLLIKIQPIFYADPTDAVFKALGVS